MSTSKLIFRFAKPYPGLIALTVILGFSGALFNGIGTALIVPVILRIVGQDTDLSSGPPILRGIMKPFDSLPEDSRMAVMAGAIILTIALKNAASYANTLTSSTLSRTLTAFMREKGINLLLDVDIDYYTKMKIGDLTNRLGGEVARAANAIGTTVKLLSVGITTLVSIGILLSISWQLTLASTFLLSLINFFNQYAISHARIYGKAVSDISKDYSIAVLETLNGIRLVKSTGNEEKEYKKIIKLVQEREKADFKSQANSEVIAPISEVMGITVLLLIVYLSRTFFKDQISSISEVILMYLVILLRTLPLVSQLNTLRSAFANNSPSLDMVAEFLERGDKPFMAYGNHKCNSIEKGIHFNNISFRYPGNEKLVLKDVDLYLPRGTTLALVGGSGAGKSTLADLLPRFYDPISGSITIDGINLQEFDLKSLRREMGVVSQDTFLFNDSVKNNIAYGKPDATEEEVIIATKRANAYEFIVKLPQGFDTIIGDRGVMLSGGQRQRLAIARALLQDPKILILDEATSALDTVSERLVQEAIDELSRERTSIVIAHRLSTVQKAHQIAVLEQGSVVEVGTHEELLEKGGYYSRLYSMQFADKKEEQSKSPSQSFTRISHEIRTRLNSMIGFLRLLLDDMAENPQEKQELIEQSYKSAFRILNAIDIFDDAVSLQQKWQLQAVEENGGVATQTQSLTNIVYEFRTIVNSVLSSLRSLADDLVETPQEQNELITEVYKSAMNLLNYLEKFEDKVT
jgi:ATP-binding cassette, subfamily B, bacterial MsbA